MGADLVIGAACVVAAGLVLGSSPRLRGVLFRVRGWWWRQGTYDPGDKRDER